MKWIFVDFFFVIKMFIYFYIICRQESRIRMIQWVKALATDPNNLS